MPETTDSDGLKTGLAEMLKRGVIMDVVTAEQARIAEDSGAVAVMALEQVPADIRRSHGVARMSSPDMVRAVMEAVDVPVMAKCRIGHHAEASVLQALGVDFVDESEVLAPADEEFHIDKRRFDVPFVCGATDLGEALRRVSEGAALLRTKGEAGTGNIVEAVRHLRRIRSQLHRILALDEAELTSEAKALGVSVESLSVCRSQRALPVPNFAAGGVATPADAALVMQLGAESVFVGSGIFKSEHPENFARGIVHAVAHYDDPRAVLEASRGLAAPMAGLAIESLAASERFADRGI
ncbi:MAG: pyridoxal 5'-phosphate synthase lyase subunit PdxS [Myxococcota bacterium]